MADNLTPEEVRALVAEALSAKLGRVIGPADVTFQVEARMEAIDIYGTTVLRGEFKGAKIKM